MLNSIWIELHQEMPRHPKTLALAQALKISRRETVGILIDLWTWGLSCADADGGLKGMDEAGIALALDWPVKKSTSLVKAFVQCGWLDDLGNSKYRLHDWQDYTSKLSEKRKDAERKRRARKAANHPDASPPFPQNVPGQSADSPPQNAVNPRAGITQPNLTEPNHPNPPTPFPAAEESPEPSDALRGVLVSFEKNIHPPKAAEAEVLRELCETYPAPSVLAAIAEAKGKGRSANYIRSILEGWKQDGVKISPGQKETRSPTYDLEEYEKLTGEVRDLP